MPGEHDSEREELASRLRGLVEAELARMGVRATPRLDAEMLILQRGAHETRAEIRGTLAQWDSLPDDLRDRRVQQIAALLAAESPIPVVQTTPAERRQDPSLRWFSLFAPIAVVALTGAAIALAYRYLAPHAASTPAGVGPLGPSNGPATTATTVAGSADPDRERFALASAACAHTRARVSRGANVGPADTEGWVVELALLRSGAPVDLSLVPGLAKFITRKSGARTGTLSWPAATHLAAAQRFDAEVAVNPSPALGDGRLSGLSLVFSGPYVGPYFADEQRGDYLNLAAALANELQATEGALFAHCSDSESHYIGSWFLGPTPGGAVGSLIYFMASYSDVPLLKPNVLGSIPGPPDRGHTFDAINAAATSLDRNAAATLVGRELGMVSGTRDHGVVLTFPFRDANRARRASVIAARALRLANSG
ncbi:MAG TPA: hypothetical protein VNW92_16225 [Polyangiaceae bacterium]|nr:hypothetical protein [Polyangiaceae bacterium]